MSLPEHVQRIIYGPPVFRVWLGTEGGNERVIFCTRKWSFYLAVRVLGRYYRLAMGPQILGFIYVGRS